MIVVTSISCNHHNKDQQQAAINSWQMLGDCYSLNTESEYEILKDQYSNIEFVKTDRTTEYYVGKPLISIGAIVDFAKDKKDDLVIINSDIILAKFPEIKNDGITLFSRYDYSESFENCKVFELGFDVFHIPKTFLSIFPPCIYAMGASHWDHAVPYHVIKMNIPLYYPEGIFAYHKIHPTQYDYKQWEYMADFFKWQFKMPKHMTAGHIATMCMQKIMNYVTRY